MSTLVPARIFFIVARDANKAVVFRKGPTRWTQMLTWNLDNDSLEYGQWIKKKINPWRCDLSPSGKYLVYLVDQFEQKDSRTIISKPPYWTALTAWEHPDPLFGSGGGLFKNEQCIQLNWHRPLSANEKWPVPPQLKLEYLQNSGEYNLWKGQINPLLNCRLERDGWKRVEDKIFVQKETEHLLERTVNEYWATNYPDSLKSIEPELWAKAITGSSFLYMITFYHSEDRKLYNKFYLKRREEKKNC